MIEIDRGISPVEFNVGCASEAWYGYRPFYRVKTEGYIKTVGKEESNE